jgi:hypothetical protein
MANEIKMQASLSINTTNFNESFQPGSISIDLASNKGDGGVQEIASGGEGEALGVTDVTVGGVCFFRNTDDTNFVEIGFRVSATFYPFLKLLPGEFSVGRLGNAAPYARADTASVDLQYRLLSP